MGGLLDVLRSMGRGAKRVPRVIGGIPREPKVLGAFGEEETDEEDQRRFDESDLMGPADWETREEGQPPEDDLSEEPLAPPAFTPNTEALQPKPKPKRDKLRIIRDMIDSGLAGATTPNVAYGGPVDILRSIQVGRRAPMQRDMLTESLQRQREKSTADIAHTQAQTEQAQSQAVENRARAAILRAPAPKPKDTVIAVKDGLYNLTTNDWISQPTKPVEPVENQMLRDLANPETPEARTTLIKQALEYRYGHRAPQERNPTEASIAYDAATGDEIAIKAWGLLQNRPRGSDDATERDKHRAISGAWVRNKTDLNQAQQHFDQQKAALDKPGVRPGTRVPGAGESRMSWDEYNERLHDLETSLQDQKNNAQGALESVLAEYDVPVTPARYPHPSTQRRTPQKVAPNPKKPGEVPPPPDVAAKISESGGKRGERFFNPTRRKVEIWTKNGGKLVFIRDE